MLYLFIFILEVVLVLLSEKRRWGNLLTPLTVLVIPYTLATIVAIWVSYTNNDVPDFYFPSLIVWIFGIFLFWIPSHIISTAVTHKKHQFSVRVSRRDDSYALLNIIAFICIAVSMTKLSSLSGSLDTFGTDEFSEEYETTGIFNHLTVVLSAIFSYSIYKMDIKRHKISIVIVLLSLVGMFAVGTKSWIILPFLIGYYARLLTGKTVLAFKTTLLPLIVIVGVFILSYYLILILAGGNEMNSQVMTFLVNHFTNYLSGSSLSLSIDFQKGFLEPEMTKSLFAPLLNIYNVIAGNNYVAFINPTQIDIGLLGETNVRTFFGTIYAYSHSAFVFILMSLVWSTVINLIYLKSKLSRSLFILLANCTNMALLTFGFFDFTWLNLTPYEVLMIFVIMHFFLYRTAKKSSNIVTHISNEA